MPLWADCIELYLTSNPVDNCSADAVADNEPVDALPPDLNDDCRVNMLDVFQMFPFWLGSTPTGREAGREDLNADGSVNMLDVFLMFPVWLDTCT